MLHWRPQRPDLVLGGAQGGVAYASNTYGMSALAPFVLDMQAVRGGHLTIHIVVVHAFSKVLTSDYSWRRTVTW